jgi:hypothetical protein
MTINNYHEAIYQRDKKVNSLNEALLAVCSALKKRGIMDEVLEEAHNLSQNDSLYYYDKESIFKYETSLQIRKELKEAGTIR